MTQGSSFLQSNGYAIMHRQHHAYSDNEKDPHSPHHVEGFWISLWKEIKIIWISKPASLMLKTKKHYGELCKNPKKAEEKFRKTHIPQWKNLEILGSNYLSRISWGVIYTLFYIWIGPPWWCFLFLPIHWLMGPIHGAIVNWHGHMTGRSHYKTKDKSTNVWWFMSWLMLGETNQNFHHKNSQSPNFTVKKSFFTQLEYFDPCYPIIWVLDKIRIIRLKTASS